MGLLLGLVAAPLFSLGLGTARCRRRRGRAGFVLGKLRWAMDPPVELANYFMKTTEIETVYRTTIVYLRRLLLPYPGPILVLEVVPLPVIMSIIRSSRNPRQPQLQPPSVRYKLIKKKSQKKKLDRRSTLFYSDTLPASEMRATVIYIGILDWIWVIEYRYYLVKSTLYC